MHRTIILVICTIWYKSGISHVISDKRLLFCNCALHTPNPCSLWIRTTKRLSHSYLWYNHHSTANSMLCAGPPLTPYKFRHENATARAMRNTMHMSSFFNAIPRMHYVSLMLGCEKCMCKFYPTEKWHIISYFSTINLYQKKLWWYHNQKFVYRVRYLSRLNKIENKNFCRNNFYKNLHKTKPKNVPISKYQNSPFDMFNLCLLHFCNSSSSVGV